MPKYNPHDHPDARDYSIEARNMVRPLSKGQCYELYEIVINKQKARQSPTRQKELAALQIALESRRDLDEFAMEKILRGYKSSMAHDARASDGNTIKYGKKA